MSVYTAATKTSRWKNDFIEKRRIGSKNEVPEWKRDLLKRIHSKKALELKQRMDTKPDEDVVEEHIPKVNENVFLVHEKQHHPARAVTHSEHTESTMTNHDVIPQNVIIIENDINLANKPNTNEIKPTKRENVEMPSSGIVHRLMGRFEGGAKTHMRYRSKSTTSLWSRKEKSRLGINETEVAKTKPKSNSLSRTYSTDVSKSPLESSNEAKDIQTTPETNGKIIHNEELKINNNKSIRNVDIKTHISNVAPKPYHRSYESAHAVKSPVLSPRSPVAKSSPTRFAIPMKDPIVPIVIENKENESTVDTSKLHATNEINDKALIKQSNVDEKSAMVTENRHQDKLPNGEGLHSTGNSKMDDDVKTSAAKTPRSRTTQQKVSERKPAVVPPYQNGFIASKSTEIKQSNSASKKPQVVLNNIQTPNKPNKTLVDSNKNSNFNASDLGFTDDSPNSKAAKALLEISSKSKTFQINPRKTPVNQEPVKKPSSNKSVLPDIKPVVSVELPATSIDDVIIPVQVEKVEDKPPSVFEEIKKDKLKSVPEPKPVTRNIAPMPRSSRPTTVTSSSGGTPSIFGTKVSKSKPSPQGGRSFVIDPSKFKKQSPNNQITTTKATTVTMTTTKRKPTVDEITVIGGYVKLERSCLSKAQNKTKKTTRIKFNMEEVTHEYVSERSLIAEHTHEILQNAAMKKTPGQAKESSFGKYTPKYLLSMGQELLENEKIISPEEETVTTAAVAIDTKPSTDATPTDTATKWSEDTSADMLF